MVSSVGVERRGPLVIGERGVPILVDAVQLTPPQVELRSVGILRDLRRHRVDLRIAAGRAPGPSRQPPAPVRRSPVARPSSRDD